LSILIFTKKYQSIEYLPKEQISTVV